MTPANRRLPRAEPLPELLDTREREAPPEPAPTAGNPRWDRIAAVLRTVLGVLVVASASTAVAWGARQYVRTSARFFVTEMVVLGEKQRSEAELLQQAGLRKGVSVFAIDLDEARGKLLADPWISEATLARRLPGTILVQVREREAGAIVALGESYLASRDGEIFKKLDVRDPADLPVITGISPDLLADDREGVKRTIRRALDLASDFERAPLGQRAPLQEIHVAADGAVTLVVGKNALSLSLGEPPFRRKLDQAARVLREADRRGVRPDILLLDNDARPDRVVLRVR